MSLLPHLFHLPCALRQRAPAALALARVAVGGGGGDTSCRSCKHTYAAVTPALCRKVASPGASSSSPSSTQSAGQHHSMSSFRTSSGGALLLTGAHQCSSSSSCHTTTTQQQPLFFSLQQHSWGGAGLVAASTSTSSLSSQCWQQQQQHHGRQRSRCTWPAFASLSANSGIGQLRWNQTAASQPGTSNSNSNSSNSNQQQQQQQPQPSGSSSPQVSDLFPGLTQEQVDRDVQQLARDVFKKGQQLAGGRYKLVDKIGITLGLAEGRFTTVWKGKDLTNNRDVILKCMEAGDNTSYTSGMREAALHATAGRCPNIVAMLDAFEHRSSSGRHPVMVLEPCGASLLNVISLYSAPQSWEDEKAHVDPQGICNNPWALKKLARDTLTALDHLHKRGIVHMDVAPDNVLLDGTFMSMQETHLRTLFPNVFKALSTRWKMWRIQRLALKGDEKALDITKEMIGELQEAVAKAPARYHEANLQEATFKLTDFGRAVPYKDLLPGLPPGASGAASSDARSLLQTRPQRYNQDGFVVFSDPTYQPPEEILGISGFIAPSYDIWKLGCLLFEAATETKLFDAKLREKIANHGKEAALQYSNQHYLLDAMVTVLGNVPRELGRKSALQKEFYGDRKTDSTASVDMLLIHRGVVKATALATPLDELIAMRTLLNATEGKRFADFLSQMLRWDAAGRASAEQLLQHEWLQDMQDS